ncbi:hypothetical protein PAHAL_8G122100 [Panicum hallii]|uniref:Uncharacterized protein n=1 Tax=Panicum hallii TaxID=206008 RepID=A0A2T8I8N2_9POAL|nr:hypothetical protein PAHAL_8G122100 [Panicum hallii]
MALSSSRSSRLSASSGRGKGGGEMERLSSPVPYRVGPYDYSPEVKCHSNRKAPCWTSWSDDNPDRRYLYWDCGYYVWIDREATQYERLLLCDLRNAVWQLRREKAQEQQQVERVQEQNAELRQVIQQLEEEKDELKKKMEKMEEKEQLEQKEKRKMKAGLNRLV